MELERIVSDNGVALHAAGEGRLRIAFTERTGGVSEDPYASLNLGTHVRDDPVAVAENRRRALDALGCAGDIDRLLVPNQVHGDEVVTVSSCEEAAVDAARAAIAAGADGIVCTAPHVPVMLCYADCVPVVLALGDRGFAVVHSGWKGTYAGISGKAARMLAEATGGSTSQIKAFIGPHIQGDEYEVSPELLQMFSLRFDNIHPYGDRLLDLSCAIRQSLEESGVPSCEIHDPRLSTMRANAHFFSYRKENGICGRHAAIAVLS